MGDEPDPNIEQALAHHHEVLALRVDVYTCASSLRMPFSKSELERSYRQNNGRNIPFEGCGYTSQREFLATVPTFARITMPNDDFYMALTFEEEFDLRNIVKEMENPPRRNAEKKKGNMRIVPRRRRRASAVNGDETAPLHWPAPTYHMTINEIVFWKTKATMLSILVRFPDCTANVKDLDYHFFQDTNVHLIPEMLCGMSWNDFLTRLKSSPNPIVSEWKHGIWELTFVKGTHVVEIPNNWFHDVVKVVGTKIKDGKKFVANMVEMNGGRMTYDEFAKKYEAYTATPLDHWQRMRLIGCSGKMQFCQLLNENNEMMSTEQSNEDSTWMFKTRTSVLRVAGKRKAAADAVDVETKRTREECRRITQHAQCMYQVAMAIHKPFKGDAFLEFYRKLMKERNAPEYVRDIPLKVLDLPSMDAFLDKMRGMVRLDIDGEVFFTYIKDEELEDDVEGSDEEENCRGPSTRAVWSNTITNTWPAISMDLSYQDLFLFWIKSFIHANLKGHQERALGKLCKLFEAEATFTIFAEPFAMEPEGVLDMDWSEFIEKLKQPPLQVHVVFKRWEKNSTGWVVENRVIRLPAERGRIPWMDSLLSVIRGKQQKGRAIIYQLIDGNEGRATFQELASLYEEKYKKKLNRHERYLLMGNSGINQFCRLLGFNCFPQRSVDLKGAPQETRLVFETNGSNSIQTALYRDLLSVMKERMGTVAKKMVKQEVEKVSEMEDDVCANECRKVVDEAIPEDNVENVVASSFESGSDARICSEAVLESDSIGMDQNENKAGKKKKKRKNRGQKRRERAASHYGDIDLSTIPLPPPPTPPDLTAITVIQKDTAGEYVVDDRRELFPVLDAVDVSQKEIHVKDEAREEPMVITISSSSEEHHKYDEEKEQKTQAIMRKMFKEQQLKKLYTLPLPPQPPNLSSVYDAVLEEHLEDHQLTEPVDMEMATPVTSAESVVFLATVNTAFNKTEEPQVIDSVADNVDTIASPISETEMINEEIYPVIVSMSAVPLNQEETKEDAVNVVNRDLDSSLEDGEILDSDTDMTIPVVRKECVEKEWVPSAVSVSSASPEERVVLHEPVEQPIIHENIVGSGDSPDKEDEIAVALSEPGDEYLEEDVSSELPIEEAISIITEATLSLTSTDEVPPESQAIGENFHIAEQMDVEEVVYKLVSDLASEEASQEKAPGKDEITIDRGEDLVEEHISTEEEKNEPEEHNPSVIHELEQTLDKDEVQEHPMESSNASNTVPNEVRAPAEVQLKEKEATDIDMVMDSSIISTEITNCLESPLETDEISYVPTPVQSEDGVDLLEQEEVAEFPMDVEMPIATSDSTNKDTNVEDVKMDEVSMSREATKEEPQVVGGVTGAPSEDEKFYAELVETHESVDSEKLVSLVEDAGVLDLEKEEPAPVEHLQEREGIEEIAMDVNSEIDNKDTCTDEKTKEMDVTAAGETPLVAGEAHRDRPLLERRFLADLLTAIDNFIFRFSPNSLDISIDQSLEDRRLEEEEEDYDEEMEMDENIINRAGSTVASSTDLSKITIGKHLAKDLLKAVDNIISMYSQKEPVDGNQRSQGNGEMVESDEHGESGDTNGSEIKQEPVEEEEYHNMQNDDSEHLTGSHVHIEHVAVLREEDEHHENVAGEGDEDTSMAAPLEAVLCEDENHEEEHLYMPMEEGFPRSLEQSVVEPVEKFEPADPDELGAPVDGADLVLETNTNMEVDITIQDHADNVERSECVTELLDELVTDVETREKEDVASDHGVTVTEGEKEGEAMETDSKEEVVTIVEETPAIRLGRRLSNDFVKAIENVISKYSSENLDSTLDRSQDLDGVPFDDDAEGEQEVDEAMGPDSEVEEEVMSVSSEDSIASPASGRIGRIGFYIQLERHLLSDLVKAIDRIISKYTPNIARTQADQQHEPPVVVAVEQEELVSPESVEEAPVVVSHEGNEEEESDIDVSEGVQNIEADMGIDYGYDGDEEEGIDRELEPMEADSDEKEATGAKMDEYEQMEEKEDINPVDPVAEEVHHEVRTECELLPRRLVGNLLKAVDNIISKYSNTRAIPGDKLRQGDDETMESEEPAAVNNNGSESVEEEHHNEQNDDSVAALEAFLREEDEHHEEEHLNMPMEEGSPKSPAKDSEQSEFIVQEEPVDPDELVAPVDDADLLALETVEVEITVQSLVDNVERSEFVTVLLDELVTDVEIRDRIRTISGFLHDHDYVIPPKEAADSKTVAELLEELVAAVEKDEEKRLRALKGIAHDHDYMSALDTDDSDEEVASSEEEEEETEEVDEDENVAVSHGLKRKASVEEDESEEPVEKKNRAESEGEHEEENVVRAVADGEDGHHDIVDLVGYGAEHVTNENAAPLPFDYDRWMEVDEDDPTIDDIIAGRWVPPKPHGRQRVEEQQMGGSAGGNVEVVPTAAESGADAQDNNNENGIKTSKYTEYGNRFVSALEEAERNGEDVEAIIRRTFEALHRRD